MNTALLATLLTIGGGAIIAIIGFVGNAIVKRIRGRATEPEMWERVADLTLEVYGDGTPARLGLVKRLDATERRDVVKGYIIRSLVRQWPASHKPRLDPAYLAELDEDTLPLDHPWRVKP